MRKDGTSRKGRGVEGGYSRSVLFNDIKVCSGFILANETMIFFLLLLLYESYLNSSYCFL